MLSSTLTVPFQITSSHVPCPSCAKPHRTAPFQLNPEFSGHISFSFLCLQLFAPSYGLSGHKLSDYQFSSVAQSCPTLCDPMNRSMPGLPVHHYLLEFTQTHVHRVSDAIQPSNPLSSPSPPAPIPPSIRVFSNESTLRMRWPKYWSFSFSIEGLEELFHVQGQEGRR